MTEENVTIKITADTSGYRQGMADASDANDKFKKETAKISTEAKKGWTKVSDSIRTSAGKIGESFKKSKVGESISSAFKGKGVMEALKLVIKGLIAGLAVVAIQAAVEALGDATKKFDFGLAEQQATKMNAAFMKLGTTIGAVLSPLYTIASELMVVIANGLNSVLEGLIQVTGYVMGLVGASGAISRNATEWAGTLEDASAAANAGLAAFDKLTTLDTTGMGDAAQAQRIRDMMADAATSGEALRGTIVETLNPLNLIGNFFANIGLERQWEGFTRAAVQSWESVSELGRTVWSGISGWATESWSHTVEQATEAWTIISSAAGQIWDSLSSYVTTRANDWLSGVLEGATNLSRIIKGAIDGLLGIDLSDVWQTMAEGFKSGWQTVTTGVTETISAITTGMGQTWTTLTTGVTDAISSITTGMGQTWATLTENVGNTLTDTWQAISSITTGMGQTWATLTENVGNSMTSAWQAISEGFRTAWDGIVGYASATFNAIFGPLIDNTRGVFASISDGIGGMVDKVVTALSAVPQRMADIFSGIWDGLTGGFKGVANSIISVFNRVIDAYNGTIGRLRIENDTLGIDIGFPTISKIPMLASGGIAEPNDPFLAILGDNRKEREFVTPESTMRDVVRSVIEEQGGVRQTIEIPISLDGRVMARATYDYYAREARRRGATWY